MFEQPELEHIRQLRRAELDAEAQERRTAQRGREGWERDELRDVVRNPQPHAEGDLSRPDQDGGSHADPDPPDSEPDVER
ncbi:hypothetical protein BN2475_170064 [Paraburkholderia ribeironis]|uniref:Uncharacterized protein n=1 Tax=Paraburkholderia ribeironis TaxID=1247936 RepID=A0A1N7RUM4_9BURK|nr:hypothetical protein BN2475_170064 [Paraburkholderia ribeironis]